MLLNMYLVDKKVSSAIGYFAIFGYITFFLFIVTIVKLRNYKIVPKTNEKEKKKAKVIAILFSALTVISFSISLYFFVFAMTNVDRSPKESWSEAIKKANESNK